MVRKGIRYVGKSGRKKITPCIPNNAAWDIIKSIHKDKSLSARKANNRAIMVAGRACKLTRGKEKKRGIRIDNMNKRFRLIHKK